MVILNPILNLKEKQNNKKRFSKIKCFREFTKSEIEDIKKFDERMLCDKEHYNYMMKHIQIAEERAKSEEGKPISELFTEMKRWTRS